ncbi:MULTISPECIES: hypothetical protein [Lyngbya]|uniref:Uncharacterized protein n=1 Tax=Lyngbya aestuarii BL J TaxID=1348334 RepID=U7QK72_9CYAN|nr:MULTISPECIES: hypothetical protein [Lyngbya]EAW33273.1 hypothetical protein L8106_25170 [Lyngbya sp. PCC 8106]ERT06826.1 hypothetical protein M595_3220 [Lyngbya aestuarii BL J]
MQSKQKVTLYIPPQLHRKLKIKAAVESEPMSSLAERAIIFYLNNPEVVDEIEASHGQTHRVYSCPECANSVVIREGELVSLKNQPSVLTEEELKLQQVQQVDAPPAQQGEEKLVPC